MFEVIGWIGSILFATCALPQAIDALKEKRVIGLNKYFLWMWFWGEVLTSIYVFFSLSGNIIPLLFNYGFNLICLLIILYYYYFPKYEHKKSTGKTCERCSRKI